MPKPIKTNKTGGCPKQAPTNGKTQAQSLQLEPNPPQTGQENIDNHAHQTAPQLRIKTVVTRKGPY